MRFHHWLHKAGVAGFIFGLLYTSHAGLAAITPGSVWMPANNLQMRQDVEMLADSGILHTPIDAWPLPWSAVSADL